MTGVPLLRAAWILLALHAYFVARVILLPYVPLPPTFPTVHLHTLILLVLCLSHSVRALGAKSTAVLFLLSAVVSWTLEHVGVATGLVYGQYHYTDKLGLRLGHVPILIPMAWFMMLYPSLVIARGVLFGGLPTAGGFSRGRNVAAAFLASLVMTAWDLVMDPVMVHDGYWVWDGPGSWFGVPLQNYAGWMITTFVINLGHGLWERTQATTDRIPLRGVELLPPLLAYALMALTYIMGPVHEPALALIAVFTMGTPVLFALARVLWR